MKKVSLLLLGTSLSLLTACDRKPRAKESEAGQQRAAQMQQLDDRLARLQDAERRATERDAADATRERDQIAAEKAAIERERDELALRQSDAEKRAAQSRKDATAADARARDAERATQETARRAEQDRGAQTVSFFYEALEPHGEWIEIDRLGPCWKPNAANRAGWRPYTDGQWAWTDYGWTWKSNEPFGWAAYHYGRWARVKRLGWIWQPGTEWGPAWVAWRRSEDYIGWAPLPPEAWSGTGFNAAVDSYYDIGPGSYTFISTERLGETTYLGRAVEPEQNVAIIQQTTNITNITYKTVQNTTVAFNGGPDVAAVDQRAAQKVPRLSVERLTEARSPAEAGKATQRAGVLQLVAPHIANAAKGAAAPAPAKVRERVKAAEVEHGWGEGVDQAATHKTREQMIREARRAEAQLAPERQSPPRVPEAAKPASMRPAEPVRPEPQPPASGRAAPPAQKATPPPTAEKNEPAPAHKEPGAATPAARKAHPQGAPPTPARPPERATEMREVPPAAPSRSKPTREANPTPDSSPAVRSTPRPESVGATPETIPADAPNPDAPQPRNRAMRERNANKEVPAAPLPPPASVAPAPASPSATPIPATTPRERRRAESR